MMNLSLETFIVIDAETKMSSIKTGGQYEWTNSGMKLYPIGTILPIIKKGKECMGLGVVRSMTITESSTTIVFEVVEQGRDYSAYYNLYRNQNTVGYTNATDSYDEYDMVVPGAYTASRANATPSVKSSKPSASRSSKKRVPSYMRDLDDEMDQKTKDDIYRKIFGRQDNPHL